MEHVEGAGGAVGPVDVVLGEDARVVEAVEDGLLALADDAAAGVDAGVDACPAGERAVSDGEADEARGEKSVEEPGGPPLVVSPSGEAWRAWRSGGGGHRVER